MAEVGLPPGAGAAEDEEHASGAGEEGAVRGDCDMGTCLEDGDFNELLVTSESGTLLSITLRNQIKDFASVCDACSVRLCVISV